MHTRLLSIALSLLLCACGGNLSEKFNEKFNRATTTETKPAIQQARTDERLTTCETPFLEPLDLRLRSDSMKDLVFTAYKINAPGMHLVELARSTGCFKLVLSDDPKVVKVEVIVDLKKETPLAGPAAIGSIVAGLFLPLNAALGVVGGSVIFGSEFATIEVAVNQQVRLPGGSFYNLSSILPATHGRSGYLLPRGAVLGDLQSTPEGRQFTLALVVAMNQLIREYETGRVAALRPAPRPIVGTTPPMKGAAVRKTKDKTKKQ